MNETQDRNKPLVNVKELAAKMIWRLGGCTDLAVCMALLETFREFCDQSEVWRETRKLEIADCGFDVEQHSVCQSQIPNPKSQIHHFCVPAGCRVKSVFTVRSCLGVFPSRAWRFLECHGGHGEIETRNLHKEDMRVDFSVVPNDDNENIPQWMVDRWGGVIRSGALYRLFAMDGKPWSDATQARLEMEKWTAGLSEAAHEGIVRGSF